MSFIPADDTWPDVSSIVLQSNGKILIGGQFISYGSTKRHRIARLNSDGTLDTSFDPGNGADSGIYSVVLQSNGKILIAGDFNYYNGTRCSHIARLNSDGTLDTSFDSGSDTNSDIFSMALQSDGKVLIGGYFTTYNGIINNHLARLNGDGTLDTSFDPGDGVNGSVSSIVIKNNGKILIGGEFSSSNGTPSHHLAKLNGAGILDTSFDPRNGVNSSISTMALQSDRKIIISGTVSSNGLDLVYIARLNSDGTLDTSFDSGDGPDYNINAITIQSNGKILIGGDFTTYNGISRARIARLNNDGSLDTSFDPGDGVDSSIYSMAIQSDEKILISGYFSSYDGTSRNGIARINSDGTLDTSFDPGDGIDVSSSEIFSTIIQSNGKILIGGNFVSYDGTARIGIARLNSDGALDTSFDPGDGIDTNRFYITSVVLQSNGKILIGGNFTSYNGIGRVDIAKLNSDGSLDTSFNPGVSVGSSGCIYSMAIQGDGKILVGGWFSSYNSISHSNIARLNSDGSLDNNYTGGFNSGVNTILIY